jgi:hypothetical protein
MDKLLTLIYQVVEYRIEHNTKVPDLVHIYYVFK